MTNEMQVYEPSSLNAITITPVSAEIPPDLSFGDWCITMNQLSILDKATHWVIGDMLNFAGKRYGETYKEAQALTGFSEQTLRHDKHVAASVEKCIRMHNLSWGHHQLIASLEQDEQIRWLAQAEQKQWSVAEMRKQLKGNHVMDVMGSSASPEWYTPPHIIEMTQRLFGGQIDTDPCSNDKDNPNVPATWLYTKADDGLTKTWHGSVYMNPPYGKEIPLWVEALVDKYERGEIQEAIALLPGRIDTRWFQPLYDYLICNIRGRLNYPQSESATPFPSVVVYLGDNESGFVEIFGEIGPILKRVVNHE